MKSWANNHRSLSPLQGTQPRGTPQASLSPLRGFSNDTSILANHEGIQAPEGR